MAAQIPDLELTIQKLLYQLEKYRRAKRAELEEKEEELKVHASKTGEILAHVGEVAIVQGVERLKGVEVGRVERELREAMEEDGRDGMRRLRCWGRS